MGEGYHNFHHQFPMDYRNAFRWYQFDPTKWFIAICGFLGLATQLREFPSNEIEKGALAMKLKELKGVQDSLRWPIPVKELPIVTWSVCECAICPPHAGMKLITLRNTWLLLLVQEQSNARTLILISGFIHDVSDFLDDHPGGPGLLSANSGKDMTASFFGGVYNHSNAAHNVSKIIFTSRSQHFLMTRYT